MTAARNDTTSPAPCHPAHIIAAHAALKQCGGITPEDLPRLAGLSTSDAALACEQLREAGMAELDPGDSGPTWWLTGRVKNDSQHNTIGTPDAAIPTTLDGKILAELEKRDGDVAIAPLARFIDEDEQVVARAVEIMHADGLLKKCERFGRELWSVAPPPITVSIARCEHLLRELSDARADYLRREIKNSIKRWAECETPEYQAKSEAEKKRQAELPVGRITGETLPKVWQSGISAYCEGPSVALAPACTFEDGQQWRPKRGLVVDSDEGPDSEHLVYLLIRDDLSQEDTKRAVAEAVGELFVMDFGDDFPKLPTPPVYRCEGDDRDTPWPVCFVPRNLWPGCWKRVEEPDGTELIVCDFEKWDREQERAAGFPIVCCGSSLEQKGGAA